jgi:hypothetical protein
MLHEDPGMIPYPSQPPPKLKDYANISLWQDDMLAYLVGGGF